MNTKISNIQISIKKEVEETRDISIPCFFKESGYERYFAVLDEETQVRLTVLSSLGYTNIMHGTIDGRDLSNAYKEYELCTEEEFMTAYNKAHESIRLAPVIKTGMLYDEEKVNALKNSIAL